MFHHHTDVVTTVDTDATMRDRIKTGVFTSSQLAAADGIISEHRMCNKIQHQLRTVPTFNFKILTENSTLLVTKNVISNFKKIKAINQCD